MDLQGPDFSDSRDPIFSDFRDLTIVFSDSRDPNWVPKTSLKKTDNSDSLLFING